MPVIGFINGGSPDGMARYAAAFRNALNEAGFVEGQNVSVEYHWLEGNYDRVPTLVADLVRRRVTVIAIPGAVRQRSQPSRDHDDPGSCSASGMIPSSLVWSRAGLIPSDSVEFGVQHPDNFG